MRLSMTGISQAANVPGVFNDGVLETPTRSEEGKFRFTGISNSVQRAFHAGIGTCGDAPNPVEASEIGRGVVYGCSVNPDGVDGLFRGGSQSKRLGNGLVCYHRFIVIADKRDAKLRHLEKYSENFTANLPLHDPSRSPTSLTGGSNLYAFSEFKFSTRGFLCCRQ
jgi:hypothetical protein